jgi:hypothetical protein
MSLFSSFSAVTLLLMHPHARAIEFSLSGSVTFQKDEQFWLSISFQFI